MRHFAAFLAPLLTLGLAACAPQAGVGSAGPPLRPAANPSAVIAAELGFNRLAQDKGQWTAFRETAAKGAEMFVPERVLAESWLKGRADPPVPVKWQPHAKSGRAATVLMRSRAAHGSGPVRKAAIVTVWQRQKDGGYKWLIDMSLADELPARRAGDGAARVAECGKARERGNAGACAAAQRRCGSRIRRRGRARQSIMALRPTRRWAGNHAPAMVRETFEMRNVRTAEIRDSDRTQRLPASGRALRALLQRHPVIVAVTPAEKLHQLHQQFAPGAKAVGFQQGLLRRRIKRGDL